MTSNRMRGVPSIEYQAQSRTLSPNHPTLQWQTEDLGNARSGEQGRKDPSGASRRPPALAEHTPAATNPRQDHKDPSDAPQRPPVPPEHIFTTTDHSPRQDHEVPSATSDEPLVPPEHTPATALSPSLQGPKGASAAPSKPLVPTKPTPATIVPPSNSLSQPVSEPSGLNESKSGIQGNQGVGRGAERAMESSSSVREERNHVLAPEERENRLEDSANATTGSAQDVRQYPITPPEGPPQPAHPPHLNRGHGRDEPTHPGAAHSRLRPSSTELDQLNQSIFTVTLPSYPMQPQVTDRYVIVIIKQATSYNVF